MSDAQNPPVERYCQSSRYDGPEDKSLQAVLGRQLRRLRIEHGFDRAGIAARLGVTEDLVAAHESGTRRFKAQELLAYVRLFEVRISSFFVTR